MMILSSYIIESKYERKKKNKYSITTCTNLRSFFIILSIIKLLMHITLLLQFKKSFKLMKMIVFKGRKWINKLEIQSSFT